MEIKNEQRKSDKVYIHKQITYEVKKTTQEG